MSTNRIAKFGVPIAAVGLLGFAVISTIQPPRVQADPLVAPPATTFASTVGGVGVVEPQSELIAVASELSGVVREVRVRAGEAVKRGAPLFTLDARALSAALESANANADSAQAAALAAQVALEDLRTRDGLYAAVSDARAVSADERERSAFAVKRAEAAYAQAQAAAKAAQAEARRIAVDLDRLTVRAPIDGTVFRVNVRPGEFAAAGPQAEPLLTMGAAERLHVRVEIDEADIARVADKAKAFGVLRGRPGEQIPLELVRVEPQAVEKRALAGGSERVDTRVIEAIYAFDPETVDAFLGQRMDVFVEAAPIAPTLAGATP